MAKFSMKRPVRADYIRKYGFAGDGIWRMDLLKYEEAKNAFDRREANMKAYRNRVKNEEKAIRDYKRTKELNPDVYKAGGERAVKNLVKINNTHKSISERKPAAAKSFNEFKSLRETLGLTSTKKDYEDYLFRLKK
ncbi:MAG: hypothetical protein IJA89_06860 [Clostridia bacterium]|nr:hypothetical protein [Clostridia bacterium]